MILDARAAYGCYNFIVIFDNLSLRAASAPSQTPISRGKGAALDLSCAVAYKLRSEVQEQQLEENIHVRWNWNLRPATHRAMHSLRGRQDS